MLEPIIRLYAMVDLGRKRLISYLSIFSAKSGWLIESVAPLILVLGSQEILKLIRVCFQVLEGTSRDLGHLGHKVEKHRMLRED